MYLHGLGEDDTFDFYGNEAPVYENTDYGSSMPAPSDTGPTQSWDWTGLIGKAITTYGSVKTAEAARQTARPINSPAPARPVYSPFTGTSSGSGGTVMFLGAGLLAYLLFS